MKPTEEKDIPITITGIDTCPCHVIQERTFSGSVNVCISNWIRRPDISQSAYERLKSNGYGNAVSEAEYVDNDIKMKTPMGTFTGQKKTKLTIYRGTVTTTPQPDPHTSNQVTFVCIIVTGIRDDIDAILPRRCYNDMYLRFMRRVVGKGWRTLWGQLFIGQPNERSFHVYHTEEYDPGYNRLSKIWKFTRRHRAFNAFTLLEDNSCVNYPLGFIHPSEKYEWFTTPLTSAVNTPLYRDLRRLMKADPDWDKHPPAVHKRVAVPRLYNRNKWAKHGFIRDLENGAIFPTDLETDDDSSDPSSETLPHQAPVDDFGENMHRPTDEESSSSLSEVLSHQAPVDDIGETMRRPTDDYSPMARDSIGSLSNTVPYQASVDDTDEITHVSHNDDLFIASVELYYEQFLQRLTNLYENHEETRSEIDEMRRILHSLASRRRRS